LLAELRNEARNDQVRGDLVFSDKLQGHALAIVNGEGKRILGRVVRTRTLTLRSNLCGSAVCGSNSAAPRPERSAGAALFA
jgi:hypothetical protein